MHNVSERPTESEMLEVMSMSPAIRFYNRHMAR